MKTALEIERKFLLKSLPFTKGGFETILDNIAVQGPGGRRDDERD